MLPIAINHMSVPRASFAELLDMAATLGCVGVEVRNDLDAPLFDGLSALDARKLVQNSGVALLAVAEIKTFNMWSDTKRDEADALMKVAHASGAISVSLIPRNDGHGLGNGERQANLRLALRELKPMLDAYGLIGLIEPLGFETCSLRYKSEAVDAIEAVEGAHCFKLVHDTFHHHLADGGPIFPGQTGIVHISGVNNNALATREMSDADRILVDSEDRLGNVRQIAELVSAGYTGPISFEAFSEDVHALKTPAVDIGKSMEFICSQVAKLAA